MNRRGVRAALLLLAVVFAIDALVFRPDPMGTAVGALGVLCLLAAAARPDPRLVLAAGILCAAATAGVPLRRYDLLLAGLFVAGVAAPLVVVFALAPRLDPDAPARPRAPRARILMRAGLAGAGLLALLALPILSVTVRLAWRSDETGTLALFIMTGSALLLLGPSLVDGSAAHVRVAPGPLENLRPRGVQFQTLGRPRLARVDKKKQ